MKAKKKKKALKAFEEKSPLEQLLVDMEIVEVIKEPKPGVLRLKLMHRDDGARTGFYELVDLLAVAINEDNAQLLVVKVGEKEVKRLEETRETIATF